ncbi:MAG: single-stranded DNA-binding protein [Lachnospiraceae bacterium]|nr:single-stranded DNA-binding protein [Lachnospiraceae bacterium]
MNRVILMGRLTRDPEVRYGANEMAIARFSIAVDRRFKREGQPEADFFNCTAFRKTAEFIEKYLKKGTKVVVEGQVQNDNYTNKDGQKVYGTVIVVDNIEFAESKAASASSSAAPLPAGGPAPSSADAGAAPAGDGFMSIPDGVDDELPFA